MIIKFDEKKLPTLIKEGSDLVWSKKAEEGILLLLRYREMIDEALEKIKAKIAEDGKAIDPSFKGVVGEHIKAMFRTYGEKYTYNRAYEDDLQPFLKETKYYKVDSEKVDEYVKELNELPEGIVEKEREPIISLKVIETSVMEAVKQSEDTHNENIREVLVEGTH